MNEHASTAAGAALSASAPLAKASTAAIYGGSGAAVMSAASTQWEWLGLTPGEWQVVGIIGGVLVGFAGLAVNIAFKWLHYRLAARGAQAGEV